MSNGGASAQTVGSVLLIDSTISNTPIGVSTVYSTTEGATNGTLIIDNVDMSNNVPVAVSNPASQATILAGNAKISSWIQGREYASGSGAAKQGSQTAVTKPATLLNSAGNVFTRSKPQYETVPVASFLSAKTAGAKGDGVTDDTAAIQALFNSATASDVVYFDHGAYVITSTVKVPKDIRITGEIWPLIMAKGSAFADQANPTPVFQVGEVGDTGSFEMSDLIFETLGPAPGAVLVEWNVAETSQGSSGMWDVHSEFSPSQLFLFEMLSTRHIRTLSPLNFASKVMLTLPA
jgi:glucan 1,3-beta-glucosidase